MILAHRSSLLTTILLSPLQLTLVLALPNFIPTTIHLPRPIALALPNLTGTTNLTAPRPRPPPTPPGPVIPLIHCISTPRLMVINEYICALTLHTIVDNPTSYVSRHVTLPVTPYSQPNQPCRVELRRATGRTGIYISDQVVAGAAVAVLRECAISGGAGWAIMEQGESWYVLVYGEERGEGVGGRVRRVGDKGVV
ncbi:MAG: hypothetical protein Q9185_004946 [Variospora sp. 1 TL-2023]